MANVINPNSGPRTKTLIEQLWERMELPADDPQRIRAKRDGNDTLQLIETTPGEIKCFATGATVPISIHSTMSISLTFCRPVATTMAVIQSDPPTTLDLKAEREQRSASCDAIHGATKHLMSHDAGRQAIDALAGLLNCDALDSISQQAVSTLIKHFYGSHAGTVLATLREASEPGRY